MSFTCQYKSLEACNKPATAKVTKKMTRGLERADVSRLFYYCAEHLAKIQNINFQSGNTTITIEKVEPLYQ